MEKTLTKELINPEEMMEAYKRTRDIDIRNQLVLHYSSAVRHTIINMRNMLSTTIQQEEFFNQGIIALIDCIEKYDPSRGASFTTFIYKYIRGAMLSYMRKNSWLPYRVRVARRGALQAQAELSNKLLREPTDSEMAEFLAISEEELRRRQKEIANADMVSFDDLINVALARSSDTGEEIDASMLREELREVLSKAIDKLSAKEKQVIALCYYENLNLREIGEVLGVSQQRISYIRTNALAKLKVSMMAYLYG